MPRLWHGAATDNSRLRRLRRGVGCRGARAHALRVFTHPVWPRSTGGNTGDPWQKIGGIGSHNWSTELEAYRSKMGTGSALTARNDAGQGQNRTASSTWKMTKR